MEGIVQDPLGYNVFNHLEPRKDLVKDSSWDTIDNMVKQWLYATLSQPVLRSIIKPGSIVADIWSALEELFHEIRNPKPLN